MPRPSKVKVGDRHGRLVITAPAFRTGVTGKHFMAVPCRCDCGNACEIRSNNLIRQKNGTRSCGCLSRESVFPVSCLTSSRKIPSPSESILRPLYETQKLTAGQIACRFGVGNKTALRWLRECGISVQLGVRSLGRKGKTAPSREELEHMVHIDRLPYREIGAKYGVDRTAVGYWMRKYKIRPLGLSHSHRKDRHSELPGKETLESLYDSGHSLTMIGRMYGVSELVVQTTFKNFGIPIKESGFNGGVRYQCDDGHVVRSVYEQRVDNWLSSHSIPHIYEPSLPFSSTLKGDFLANGWYIEVWGVVGMEAYDEKRARKTELYHANQLPLIEIEPVHFQRDHSVMKKRLRACLSEAACQGGLF